MSLCIPLSYTHSPGERHTHITCLTLATNLWPTITRTLPPTLTPAIDLFCGRDVLSAAISQSDGEWWQRSQPAAAPHERRDVRNYNYTGNKNGTKFIHSGNIFIFFFIYFLM